MTNKEIAELTASIIAGATANPSVTWQASDICSGFEAIFKSIKKTVQEN